MPWNIQEQFGQIDIYVFDQILRGNITREMRVLDAGLMRTSPSAVESNQAPNDDRNAEPQ
ncbi:MAG: hypothetical protein ACRD3B_14590 [Candidatus Sulfotelmatobacter sp.]